jgi:hypothetical protein
MADIQARLAAAKADLERLKAGIEQRKAALANGSLATVGGTDAGSEERRPLGPAPRKRRVLAGHFNKVYSMDWAGDGERLVSARCVRTGATATGAPLPIGV